MDSTSSSTQSDNRPVGAKRGNQQYLRALLVVSRIITVVFLVALAWAIYQALVNGNSLPLWAWLGVIVLFALTVGLIVAAVVYRGVVDQAGPFDFRPTTHVTGELKNEVQRVEAAGASSLSARIYMTEGILGVQGGATDAMNASFIYDNADWKPPMVSYAVDTSGLGNLLVEQQSTGRPAMHQGRCEWNIRLMQDLPLDLNVKVGAGKADLKLGGLSLSKLHIESGVGALAVDLNGEWQRSLEAFIKTGIGDTILRLPRDTGVRVHSVVSMGSAHLYGLTWDGEAHVNAAFGKSPVTLDIFVESGIGKITYEGS